MRQDRDERRKARLRGPGAHKIAEVDFGISFPVPDAPDAPASTRKQTPAKTPSSNRTPAQRNQSRSTRSSQKRGSPYPGPRRGSSSSAKRRKTFNDVEAPPTTRSSRTPRADVYDIPEEEVVTNDIDEHEPVDNSMETDELDVLEGVSEVVSSEPVPVSLPGSKTRTRASVLQEVLESPMNAPGSGQRRSDSVAAAQQASSAGQGSTTNDSDVLVSTTLDLNTRGRRLQETPQSSKTSGRQISPELSSSALFVTPGTAENAPNDEIDELSPEQGRSSVLQHSTVEDEAEEAEEIDDEQAAKHLKKRRRRSSRNIADELLEADDLEPAATEEDEPPAAESRPGKKQRRSTKQQQRVHPAASPAIQRQPKQPRAKSKSSKSKGAAEVSSSRRESVAIPVHRLTGPIMVAEDDTDADILNAEIPFAKRSGVNAVDVLAEFCEETVESGLDALRTTGSQITDPTVIKEYRTKLRSVEAFREELKIRLLDMTINLDTNHQLSKRVRASQSEIKHLREEVLRVRQEREEIALRKDAVRIKHEEDTKVMTEQTFLNTAVQDLELAVEHCSSLPQMTETVDMQPVPLSMRLSSIAAQASSKAPGGGILAKVKRFNAFLERAALALEGKA